MADDTIHIEYNKDLKPLEELLSGVERAGDFFVSGTVEIPMPKVEVEGVGVLSFPVPPIQIAALIQQAVRAPYGRGEDTILDESVRKVWQLPPDKVQIGGKSWQANFDNLLQQVIAGLGCEGMLVSAQLYKILVYDTGGFFLAHRDTEKADGMFGTLVVVLPSAHHGGELVISHAGREITVDLSGTEVSEVSFAAFYADCEHEVRPIVEGNRVCLVYNLIHERCARGKGQSLLAPNYEKQIATAAALLKGNLSSSAAMAKIAWLLEHQYSPDGLSFAGLKSADAARVKVLAQAAERVNCVAHLGIIHIEETGIAEPIYESYRPSRWGRYRNEDEDSSSDSFEAVEVCDSRHYVSQWRNMQDEPVEFGEIPIAPGELLPGGALDDEKPDEQRLMEASGNEGASFERSYHRAALVIWRRERYAEVLLQAGVAAVLPHLKESIEARGGKDSPPGTREEVLALARLLINAWIEAPEYSFDQEASRPDKRDDMLMLLIELDDDALLEKFIAEVVVRDYDGSENAALMLGTRLLGAEKTTTLFTGLIRQHMRHLHGHCVALLHMLASGCETSVKPESREALRQIAEATVSKLDDVGKKLEAVDWSERRKACVIDAKLVAILLNVLGELDAYALRATAVEKFAVSPEVFDPVTILVPALGMIHKWDAAVNRLWEHSAEFLLRRSGHPPESPRDWRQDIKFSCSCADCCELQAFTLDPVEQTHRFRMRQDRRQHLHHQIEHHGLNMTHVTERKGSPQTLICTKDRRSYRRHCDQYRKDIAALTSLAEQTQKVPFKNDDILKRIKSARTLDANWQPD